MRGTAAPLGPEGAWSHRQFSGHRGGNGGWTRLSVRSLWSTTCGPRRGSGEEPLDEARPGGRDALRPVAAPGLRVGVPEIGVVGVGTAELGAELENLLSAAG